MTTATLTSKGQITIPIDVRTDLKVDAGDRVEFVYISPGRYEVVAATQSVAQLKAMLQAHSRALMVLLQVKPTEVDRADQVLRALRVFAKSKADFAYGLIESIAASAGRTHTMTSDVGAPKHSGMTLADYPLN